MVKRDQVAIDPDTAPIATEYYSEIGQGWWDPKGPLRALHDMNPTRVAYFDSAIRSRFLDQPAAATKVLDIGCGGGIVSEAMAKLDYDVTGLDMSEGAIEAARAHAAANHVAVDYRVGSAYRLPMADGVVDVVVISDVLEHLHDLPTAIAEISRVLRPGGLMLFDTINRTVASYLTAILMAERVLRIVFPGTHDWKMFIRPGELRSALAERDITLAEIKGMSPARPPHRLIASIVRGRGLGEYELNNSVSVSYIGHAVKQPARPRAVR
jgi:2-polyprenyl-6-hydroxyphenyl methylase / 3-demethylubiquinone-9 3-methyltransferase